MPKFSSLDALKTYVTEKIGAGVQAHIKDLDVANKNLINSFYGEYSPKRYMRTGNFMNTSHTMVETGGLGAFGMLFWTPIGYETGTWSAGKILKNNLSGSHGGYYNGINIYETLANTFNTEAILIAHLKAAGL